VWAAVAIPLQRIASASWAVGSVHVVTVDGREYRFLSPLAMAESITDALAGAV
jgi:hypothetical protein